MNKVNGKTKIFGVIADPIEHVKAPSIYNNRWINEKKKLFNDTISCAKRKFI